MPRKRRRVCFVTGTRAEFGLMHGVLRAIRSHPKLQLQIIATGMHLSKTHGKTIDTITEEVDRVVMWPPKLALGRSTGSAMGDLARAFDALKTDIVLVVGDRVEAFAGAAAGHISGRVVAHVHGGDRALGQVDDSLRHAITKLAHVHFPATRESAARLRKLGEDAWRIHRAGSPGIDAIRAEAAATDLPKHQFALLVLHPVDRRDRVEHDRARMVLRAVCSIGFDRVVIIHPNNDPGSEGIARCWGEISMRPDVIIHRNVMRPQFLGLLRDAAALIGNSSSGIIEAASFGTPVVDIGPRQLGRERSGNVVNVPYLHLAIRRALKRIWHNGRPRRFTGQNVYEGGASKVIPRVLADETIDARLLRKLISY